jgi:sn-glycerol 3-phosphate transport system substrate-binding protein
VRRTPVSAILHAELGGDAARHSIPAADKFEEGTMRFKLFGAVLAAAGFCAPRRARTDEIQWWHSMGGALGEKLNALATKFNASPDPIQGRARVQGQLSRVDDRRDRGVPRGQRAAPAAGVRGRHGDDDGCQGRHCAGDQGDGRRERAFRPKSYMPAVSGYYTDSKGNMLSFPFNSSTVVLYINRDAFKKAGLNPDQPPKTWKDVNAAALQLKVRGQDCVYTSGWPAWVHIENFSAWHNVPIGTKENGMGGMDTVFTINTPLHVRHLTNLGDMAKKGLFTYAGRTNQAEAKFASGECAMLTSSTGAQASFRQNAKFDWSVNFMPYYDDVVGAPQNSIIGGASVWVLAGKKPDDYKGVAKFLAFLSKPEMQMEWHTGTGYVPITMAAYDMTRKSGFYDKTPGADVAIKELTNKPPTANSKGLRFGNYVQGREVIEEEMENVFSARRTPRRRSTMQ